MKDLGIASLACVALFTGCTLILVGGRQPRTQPVPAEPQRSESSPGRQPASRPTQPQAEDRGASGRGGSSGGLATAAAERLTVPPGHLPAPGECRVWLPDEPPGRQAPAGPCSALAHQVPSGGWLIYRPEEKASEVAVNVYRDKRGKVSEVRYFDFWTGRLLRVEER